jgi:hypothetical protein
MFEKDKPLSETPLNETQDSSSVFMFGLVLGASVPLLFLALGA